MATGKRYYWIKLKDSFMNSEVVDFLMSQPNGANYVVLYQMLCLKTINTGGRLTCQIGDIIIPFDMGKIQRDCKWFSLDTIRIALGLYKQLGLIYEEQDGTLVLVNTMKWSVVKRTIRRRSAFNVKIGADNCPKKVRTLMRTTVWTLSIQI